MEKKTSPYELLARWDNDGKLSGVHVRFLTAFFDDGERVAEQISDATPVGLNGAEGFPVADILSALHADAVTAANEAASALETARAEHAEQVAALRAQSAGEVEEMSRQLGAANERAAQADAARVAAEREATIARSEARASVVSAAEVG